MTYKLLFLILLVNSTLYAQKSIEKLLKTKNTESIPYIYIEELTNKPSNIIYLDSREINEYHISHLKNAIFVGYDFFNIDDVITKVPEKTSQIVVYCSLGIRSEDIAEKLKQAGYTNVKNLYGGIFEWKNNNLPIYNSKNTETDSIHAYSKQWGKWLKNGIKIYE